MSISAKEQLKNLKEALMQRKKSVGTVLGCVGSQVTVK